MSATDKRRIEKMMEDSIMEVPIGFNVGERHFFLYPVTLGRAYLISREREGMAENLKNIISDVSDDKSLDYRRSICRIVAIQTLRCKDDIFNVSIVDEQMNYLFDNLDNEGLFCLYDIIMASMDDSKLYIKHCGLEHDKKALSRISKLKEDSGNVSFGGKTAYGSFISAACEKYGWTMDYVVWGISLTNLEMLLADAQTSVYLTKQERRQLRISSDRTFIDASDPANRERIKQLVKCN